MMVLPSSLMRFAVIFGLSYVTSGAIVQRIEIGGNVIEETVGLPGGASGANNAVAGVGGALGDLNIVQSIVLGGQTPLRLCVTSQSEMDKCGTFSNIECVLGDNGLDCVKKIQDCKADITVLDGGDIYLSGNCSSMKPIIAENIDMGIGTDYYAVAVAKKSSNVNINTLNNARTCNTGLNKTAGWYIPMSILFASKVDQLGQASAFFQAGCVPGAQPGSNLCQLCTPNCERNSNNLYYGYDGARRCLEETNADVAFVKHSTFLSHPNKNDYELLCKDGSTSSIDDYLNCNLAKVPAHAIVAKDDTTVTRIDEIDSIIHQTPDSVLFSDAFGKDSIFSSSTISLQAVYESYIDYLGPAYINALPEKPCP